MCDLDSIINDINILNRISSPTDGEGDLIKYITGLAIAQDIHVVETFNPESYLEYLKEPPILIGNPDAKYILVTHCDRVVRDLTSNKIKPLCYGTPKLENNNGILTGKLDNSVSLAVCLSIILKLKPLNTSLLITTAEELPLQNLNPPLHNDLNLHSKGGRGFISYLDYLKYNNQEKKIKEKGFICIDVRPLHNEDVFKTPGNLMALGDGLVLRLEEHRKVNRIYKRILNADLNLVNIIRGCAADNNVTLVDFRGPKGTTEVGRGWEMFLKKIHFPPEDYHVFWIQPPITNYHTLHEQMSGNDIIALYQIMKCLIVFNENIV